MQAVDFLQFLWAPDRQARFSIGTQPFGQGNDKHKRKRFDTVVQAAAYVAARAQRHDVWHTCGILKPDAEKSGRAHMLANRAFYLDLDVKPDAYPAVADAARALVAFVAAAKLPTPNAVVGSGGGMHVYWITDTLLSPEEWVPLGLRLRELALRHGLRFDTNVPGDVARILRTPGTFNGKIPTNLRPVKVLSFTPTYIPVSAMRTVLMQVPMATVSPGQAPAAGKSDLSSGLYDDRPRSMAGVIRECPAMRDLLLKRGNVGNYPLWRDMLSVAAHTADGHKFIGPMSDGHPTYTAEALQKYWNDTTRRKAEGSMGPATCETIASNGMASLCATCRHRTHIKSPIRLASEIITAPPAGVVPTTAAPQQPLAYLLHPDSANYWFDPASCQYRVRVEDEDDNGNTITYMKPVLNGFISQIERHFEDGQTSLRMRYHTSAADRTGSIVRLQLEKTTSRNEGYLPGAGLLPEQNQFKEVVKMLLSWSQRLAQSQTQIPITHYGWVKYNGTQAFALGNRVFWPDGRETQSLIDADDVDFFKPTGTLDVWKAIAQKCHDAFTPALRVVLASSFASPLVAFSSNGSARVLSAYSRESGLGKSFSSIVAQSVWGEPGECRVRSQATPAAVQKLAGRYHSLPLLWDDVRSMTVVGQTDPLQQLLFQLVEGSEKRRFTDPHHPASWNCLTIITSNHSMRAKARNVQEGVEQMDGVEGPALARILELQVPQYTTKADLDVQPLYANYGHPGAIYAAYLSANQAAVTKLVQGSEAAIGKVYPHGACRFHVSTIACLLVAAKIATDLNLIRFDMASLWGCLEPALRSVVENDDVMSNRKTAAQYSEDDLYNLLASFLNRYDTRTLITVRQQKPGHQIQPAVIKEPPTGGVRNDAYGGIVIDITLDTGEMLIDLYAFRDFCMMSQRDVAQVRDAMKKLFGMTNPMRRMGARLPRHEKIKRRVLLIELHKHPKLAEFLDELRNLPSVAVLNLAPLPSQAVH